MARPAKKTVKVETSEIEAVKLDHSKEYTIEATGKTVHMKEGEIFKNVNGSLAEILVNSGKATIID